jgi:hypothetical protein
MANPCFVNQTKGENPITEDERFAIWKWAKENAIDPNKNPDIDAVGKQINDYFFGGQAHPDWITEILSGRKTPFREVANDMWKQQYNRRVITQQAQEVSRLAGANGFVKLARAIWSGPRSLSVFGHGVVFPITHAGDLIFRPSSWSTFFKGALNSYRGAFSKAFTEQALSAVRRDPLYDTALRSGVDVGPKSHPSGLISRTYTGPASRAWDMLTVMRFELWKKQMGKFVKPEMNEAQVNEIGKSLAEWANHATGSATGAISKVGGEALFGPKLTQSKISRLVQDPIKTVKTFANWRDATPGERAVAWTRLSGATQYLGASLGFLAVNQGILMALGQKDKINISDPTKGDFMSFKGADLLGNVPGLHSEIRVLSKILATAFLSKKQMMSESRFGATAKTLGQYGMGKLHPTLERGLELGFRQDWLGRPLPWSSEKGTASRPKLTYGEYAASIGPIPLEGPISFVYDHLKEQGMSAADRTTLIKALIVGGMGAPGFHVREDYTKKYRGDRTPKSQSASTVIQ